MEQTKPFFIIRKYRSILRSLLVVEVVTYIFSLTDTLVAGNVVGEEAMSHLFHGFSSSAQPLVGTLRGEGNGKAIRDLMRTVSGDVLKSGLLLSAAVAVFAPLFVRAFGIGGSVYAPCVEAVRIVGATVFCYSFPLHRCIFRKEAAK